MNNPNKTFVKIRESLTKMAEMKNENLNKASIICLRSKDGFLFITSYGKDKSLSILDGAGNTLENGNYEDIRNILNDGEFEFVGGTNKTKAIGLIDVMVSCNVKDRTGFLERRLNELGGSQMVKRNSRKKGNNI